MPEYPAGQERRLRQLISTFRCSVCRRNFERSQVRVAARQDKGWIISVRCSQCRNQQIFLATLKQEGVEERGLELPDAELERFAQMPPISFDDILDMHEFLDGFDGDFKGLFGD